MHIEIISGSPRSNSVSHRVALHLLNHLTKYTDHTVSLLDVRDWDLPPVETVVKSVYDTPPAFKTLR